MLRLHVTSGHSISTNLRAGGVAGEFLSWPDVLFEGPVPGGTTLDALSYVRAPFIADRYSPGEIRSVLRNLLARNERLRQSCGFDEVTLWFGHHLGDQLRLIQLLSWFAASRTDEAHWTLVCIDRHPEVAHFRGLEQLDPAQLAALDWIRRRVTDAELGLARRAWAAFTDDRPTALVELAGNPCWAIPQLPPALIRHLQQFPGKRDGLARTEREILDHVALRKGTVRDAFEVTQRGYEEAPFMGGASFLAYVERMALPSVGLLALGRGFSDDRWSRPLATTTRGRGVLAGRLERFGNRGIDRWLGGVYLKGSVPAWCWDDARQTVTAASARPRTARPRSTGQPIHGAAEPPGIP